MLAITQLSIWWCLISSVLTENLNTVEPHQVFRRNFELPERLAEDQKWCQISKDLRQFAEDTKRLYADNYPNLYDPEISPIECLQRLAILASKSSATAEQLVFVDEWAEWWRSTHAPVPYDSRSNVDKFFAYTIERKLHYVAVSPSLLEFEKNLVARIRGSDEAITNQSRE